MKLTLIQAPILSCQTPIFRERSFRSLCKPFFPSQQSLTPVLALLTRKPTMLKLSADHVGTRYWRSMLILHSKLSCFNYLCYQKTYDDFSTLRRQCPVRIGWIKCAMKTMCHTKLHAVLSYGTILFGELIYTFLLKQPQFFNIFLIILLNTQFAKYNFQKDGALKLRFISLQFFPWHWYFRWAHISAMSKFFLSFKAIFSFRFGPIIPID